MNFKCCLGAQQWLSKRHDTFALPEINCLTLDDNDMLFKYVLASETERKGRIFANGNDHGNSNLFEFSYNKSLILDVDGFNIMYDLLIKLLMYKKPDLL